MTFFNVTLPVLVTVIVNWARLAAELNVAGPVFTTDSSGLPWGPGTVADPWPLTASPSGSVPRAVAVLRISPAATSA